MQYQPGTSRRRRTGHRRLPRGPPRPVLGISAFRTVPRILHAWPRGVAATHLRNVHGVPPHGVAATRPNDTTAARYITSFRLARRGDFQYRLTPEGKEHVRRGHRGGTGGGEGIREGGSHAMGDFRSAFQAPLFFAAWSLFSTYLGGTSVSTESSRRGRGVAATRLHFTSAAKTGVEISTPPLYGNFFPGVRPRSCS